MQVDLSNLLQNFHHYEIPFTTRIEELKREGKKIISFSGGDAALLGYKPPAYTTTALVNAAKKNLTMYPSSARDLIVRFREAVSKREQKVHQIPYDPEDIIWTNGVTHSHNLIYFSLLGPKDECILLEPAYFSWCEYAYIYPFKLVSTRGGVEDNEWSLDPDDIRAKLSDKTKVLIMVNPNNPTGAVWDEKLVKKVIDIAGEHDIVIVSDEIYDLTVFDGIKSVPAASLAKDVPVITLNGMTKNWLLQGWRVGYMLFHDPESKMSTFKKKFMDYVNFNLLMPPTIMAAATEVLEQSLKNDGMNHLDVLNRKLEKHRDYLWKRTNEIKGVSCVKPRSGYFAFPLIEGVGTIWKDDRDFVLDLLNEGVYLRPGFLFGQVYGRRHVRISFLLSMDEMKKGFDLWEAFMNRRVH